MVYFMEKSELELDDDWGYPYFRKPPFYYIISIIPERIINPPAWFNTLLNCSWFRFHLIPILSRETSELQSVFPHLPGEGC